MKLHFWDKKEKEKEKAKAKAKQKNKIFFIYKH